MNTVARSRCLLLAMGLGLAVHASANAPVIAVYRGDAGCPGCSEAVEQAIHRSHPDYHVVFVGPGEAVDVDSLATSRYRAYVQPGAGRTSTPRWRRWAKRGGSHPSFRRCRRNLHRPVHGAYLAGASHRLLAQDLDAEAGRPGFPVQDEDDAVIPVVWDGRRQTVYFQDGPYLPKAPRDQGFKVISATPMATLRLRRIATEGQGGAVGTASGSAGAVVQDGGHPAFADAVGRSVQVTAG